MCKIRPRSDTQRIHGRLIRCRAALRVIENNSGLQYEFEEECRAIESREREIMERLASAKAPVETNIPECLTNNGGEMLE